MNKKLESVEIGKQYGEWTVLKRIEHLNNNQKYYLCRCSCGVEKPVCGPNLTRGCSKSCGNFIHNFRDITGKKFGKYTVIKFLPDHKNYSTDKFWQCKCECGKLSEIPQTVLEKGKIHSCRRCLYEDLTGQRFGNQTVVLRDHKTGKWLIKCDCGEEKFKTVYAIKHSKSCGGRCESKAHIGKKFGKLRVLGIIKYEKNNAVFIAKCDCGNLWKGGIGSLKGTENPSCGCLREENHLKKAEKMIGKKFGELTIKHMLGYLPGTRRILYQLQCSCGNTKIVLAEDLGSSKSCGCLFNKNIKKGEEHPGSTLKKHEVEMIKELLKTGIYSQRKIAEMFSVSEGVISHISIGKTYQEID